MDPLLRYMPMMFLSRVGSTARRYHVCAGTKQKQVHLHIPKSALVRILQPKQWVDRRSAVRSRIRKPFALHTETSQGAGAGAKVSPPTCLHVHYNYNYQKDLGVQLMDLQENRPSPNQHSRTLCTCTNMGTDDTNLGVLSTWGRNPKPSWPLLRHLPAHPRYHRSGVTALRGVVTGACCCWCAGLHGGPAAC